MAKENTDKPNKSKEKTKDKSKRKRGRIKETFSELKKVTWPSFGTVVKQTGIVLTVVLAFLIVLVCFDQLLGWLYGYMIRGLSDTSASAVVAAVRSVAYGGKSFTLWL